MKKARDKAETDEGKISHSTPELEHLVDGDKTIS